MSGGFPLISSLCNAQLISTPSGSVPAAVVSSATANTSGSWTQLIAATASECCLLELQLVFFGTSFGGGPVSAAIDIGIGSAGSEQVLIPSLLVSPPYLNSLGLSILIPVSIPAGTRVAARVAVGGSAGGSATTVQVSATIYDGSFDAGGGAGVDCMGFVSSTTLGTAATAGGTVNTKGAYAQLIASTARDYRAIFGCFDAQNNNAQMNCLVDIAVGASGSETIIIPNRYLATAGSGGIGYAFGPVGVSIPAGTRLSFRHQSDTASAVIGLTLYGVF